MCSSECPTLTPNTITSHCGACHETFSTVRNFDRHRVNFQCVDPATKGMHLSHGRWRETRTKTLDPTRCDTDRTFLYQET